jgi:hypothetical protein
MIAALIISQFVTTLFKALKSKVSLWRLGACLTLIYTGFFVFLVVTVNVISGDGLRYEVDFTIQLLILSLFTVWLPIGIAKLIKLFRQRSTSRLP